MNFITESHRHAETILKEPEFAPTYQEIVDIIHGISDEDIAKRHIEMFVNKMSLSHAINSLLDDRFVEAGWTRQAKIFQEKMGLKERTWRLDFAKGVISIEVGFNHGEAIAWNLMKPVLASEKNHVEKVIQTKMAVMICATKALKIAGAFDGAVGEFEKIKRYLMPMNTILTTPMLLIGLLPPESFKVTKDKGTGRNIGTITYLS